MNTAININASLPKLSQNTTEITCSGCTLKWSSFSSELLTSAFNVAVKKSSSSSFSSGWVGSEEESKWS